jgi:CRISPR-associated protein Csm3
MLVKLEIKGKIKIVTGMHIGGSTQFSAIGAVDSPVIRDVISKLPMIPASSLKGKMRSLLAKQYNTKIVKTPDDDDDKITRLFGSAKKDNVKNSRLIFSDMIISNADDLKRRGVLSTTEVKVENNINRATAVANPRQIERCIRDSEFPLSIIYNAEKEDEIVEDIKLLKDGMKLLKYDYLGGSGSRGYGRVDITDLEMNVVVGSMDENIQKECKKILEEV